MSSPLLTLPPELRNQILETLFFGADVSTLCRCHRPNPFQRANYGILSANKQLHREASSILFHDAVLHLGTWVKNEKTPFFTTSTVLPIWSWLVRDRYHVNGTDIDFLQHWYGLKKIRHVVINFASYFLFRHDSPEYDLVVGLLKELPELESLTIRTRRHIDKGGSREFVLKKLIKNLRPSTTAKPVLPEILICYGKDKPRLGTRREVRSSRGEKRDSSVSLFCTSLLTRLDHSTISHSCRIPKASDTNSKR